SEKTEELPSERLKKTLVQVAIEDDDYVIEVTPSSVAGAATESINTIAKQLGKKVEIKLGSSFVHKGRSKNISAEIIHEGMRIALDVPSVKSFDRSGGVAAFYAINRCKEGIESGTFQKAILIVPRKTGGAKYSSVRDSNKDTITVVEINQKEAELLILKAKDSPSEKAREIASIIFPELIQETVPEESKEDSENSEIEK
ncbi:MAG: hypothetical protein ACXQS8_09795, partial [Candidatus Helarchaeales archaeon]